MLRRLLIAIALLASGCSYEHFIRLPLADEQLEQTVPAAAHDLGCRENSFQARYRTLLTRTVRGCDRELVYAYDWMLDRWWGDFDESE